MPLRLDFTTRAEHDLHVLEFDKDKMDLAKLKKVRKCLGLLETSPRHRSLQTHPYESLVGGKGEKVFEAYVENRTPAAWRVFWHYGEKGAITIVTITAHP